MQGVRSPALIDSSPCPPPRTKVRHRQRHYGGRGAEEQRLCCVCHVRQAAARRVALAAALLAAAQLGAAERAEELAARQAPRAQVADQVQRCGAGGHVVHREGGDDDEAHRGARGLRAGRQAGGRAGVGMRRRAGGMGTSQAGTVAAARLLHMTSMSSSEHEERAASPPRPPHPPA